MIAFIKGIMGESWDNTCIVLTPSGLGYEVLLPLHTWSALPSRGENVEFYISTVIREDAFELFGFSTFEEKRTFEILKGISRIGPRTALAIIAAFRPDDLRRIALEGNLTALAKVPGIGKKTAQILLLELKDKLKDTTPLPVSAVIPTASTLFTDAVSVLVNLGYDETESGRIVRQIVEDEPDLDESEIVRASLKILAKGKA